MLSGLSLTGAELVGLGLCKDLIDYQNFNGDLDRLLKTIPDFDYMAKQFTNHRNATNFIQMRYN